MPTQTNLFLLEDLEVASAQLRHNLLLLHSAIRTYAYVYCP